jgi:oligoribonuclease NrnB/cAMP/cGMP phosphodiesterase (DHH superfamily)
LDYAPKSKEELRALEEAANPFPVWVIDHHNTAKSVLEGRSKHTVFNEEHSGGRLAWDHFNGKDESSRPLIVDYTEDRDLWNWQLPQSRQINAWLSAKPLNDPHGWGTQAVALDDRERTLEIVTSGQAILEYQEREKELALEKALEFELPGGTDGLYKVRGVNFNVRSMVSDVAGALAKDRPFGFCWWLDERGLITLSLRSREGGIHVGNLCRWFAKTYDSCIGGGGHPQAAGCEWKRFPKFLAEALDGHGDAPVLR